MLELSDIILIFTSLSAGLFCIVLSVRLRRFLALDNGIGAAIAALSKQVDGMQKGIDAARQATGASTDELRDMTARAEIVAGRLELLLASVHEREPAMNKMRNADPRTTLMAGLREMQQSLK